MLCDAGLERGHRRGAKVRLARRRGLGRLYHWVRGSASCSVYPHAPSSLHAPVCFYSYYGRPFQARNKAKGGAFSSESNEYLRFKVGDGTVIGAFDEAVRGMRVGGVRRVVIGPGPLFYPSKGARKLLPQPSTFSGERALYFVLENQGLIDKTLLFDLELKYVE